METKRGFPSQVITRASRTVGTNKRSANMMARCMHRNLHDALDHEMVKIGTKGR